MKQPEHSKYTAHDFLAWRDSDSLVLTPKFQRRGVWTTPARSYFIDTLIQRLIVPPLYLRVVQNDERTRAVREVVDGQQRVSALLDFIDGKYALSKSLDAPYAGKRFTALGQVERDAILSFSFSCEVLYGASDADILEIFARVNMYSVRLNAQELRNGKYFGHFKQAAYRLAHEHVGFWRDQGVFTDRTIARMREVELTSELMIVQLAGLQDKKASIDDFYEEYDEVFRKRKVIEAGFRSTFDSVVDSVGEILRSSEFHRPPLFYTLFGAVYHRACGVPGQRLESPRRQLSNSEERQLQDAVLKLSGFIEMGRRDKALPKKFRGFVGACLRQTDNIRPRQTRFEVLYRSAFLGG